MRSKKKQAAALAAAKAAEKAAEKALDKGKEKARRSFGLGKLVLVAIVGGALALGLNEDLRGKVLDALFGAEEEFEYTSTTSPAAAPEPAVTP